MPRTRTTKTAARWVKGQSGNPAGRPPGIPNPGARLRKMIDAEAIVARLQAAALAGDVMAARTLLERVIPPLKATRAPAALPGIADAFTLTERAQAVLRGVADGTLTTDQASELLGALAATAKILETDELERRIAALELQT